VKAQIDSLLERMPPVFDVIDIQARMVDKTPYLVVMLQECDRMNALVFEMTRALKELKMGMDVCNYLKYTTETTGVTEFL